MHVGVNWRSEKARWAVACGGSERCRMRKVRASQGRIVGNAHRRRLQGQCNREIPPRFGAVRVERRGKSSPTLRVTAGSCKPYPKQHRIRGRLARPLIPRVARAPRQRGAKTDDCRPQNPAYSLAFSHYFLLFVHLPQKQAVLFVHSAEKESLDYCGETLYNSISPCEFYYYPGGTVSWTNIRRANA